MTKLPTFAIILLFTTTTVKGQSAKDSVKQVINKMFTAMRNSDEASLRSCFHDSAYLQTIARTKEGTTIIRNESIDKFAAQIGKLPKDSADERITFDMVKVDAALASVWTPYKFYYNGKFSHCGVNSFQLVRLNGQWRIQYIIDTRRKDKCK